MKRKVYYLIGAIVIVLAIVVASVFLFSTKNVAPVTDFKLDGAWRLFNCTNVSENTQYLVFSDNVVEIHRDGESVSSKFEYSDGALKLSDLDFDCRVDKKTDNYLVLYDSNRTEYTLVRSAGDGMSIQEFDWNILVGTWDVVIHGKGFSENEQMVFDGTSLKDYRDDSPTPYLNSAYTIKDKEKGVLVVDSIGLELNLCYLDSNLAILVETQTGYAYELTRHK